MKITRIILMLVLTLGFIAASGHDAYGAGRRTSATITTTVTVLPTAELNIGPARIDRASASLDTNGIADLLAANDKGLVVEKLSRNGREIIQVTKVFE